MSASIFRLMPSMVRSSTRSLAPHVPDVVIILLLLAPLATLFYQYRVQALETGFERMATDILARASQSVRAELDALGGDALFLANHPDLTSSFMEQRFETLLRSIRPAGPGTRLELLDSAGQLLHAPAVSTPLSRDHRWSEEIALAPSNADHPHRLILRISLTESIVAAARRKELATAWALWLLLSVPMTGLMYLARRAHERQRNHITLAESQERLLEAERLACLGHRWDAHDDALTLSPQAPAMPGKQPGRQSMHLVDTTALHVVDITEPKDIERRLRSLTAEREMILNRIPAFVIYKDCNGVVVHANRMSSVYARKPLDQIVGKHSAEIFPNSDAEKIRSVDEEVIRTGAPKLGITDSVVLEDGSTQWFEIDVFPDVDDTGKVTGIVIFGLDITQRRRAEEQVAYLAMHDPLTDLCNRRLLADRLSQTLAHCSRRERHCSLLFVDLDFFKRVNDEHGHEIGDLLLVQVSHRLRGCVRSEDTVARTGGDEFVILLSETSSDEDSIAIAEKIRAALELAFEVRGVTLAIGCSIGVANYPEHGRSERDLMIAADTAMYAAKNAGRNAVRLARTGALQVSEDDAA